MGQVSFGELAYWLVTLRRPTPGELRVFEAVLVALADHGFTPTAIAARVTLLSAPDSMQGALAAGPARRRVALPRRDRGHRPVPGHDPCRARRAAARRPTPGGTRWRATAIADAARHGAASSRVWVIPCTRSRTRGRRC